MLDCRILRERAETNPVIVEPKRNVLILTAPTGAGHDCVAVALREAAHDQAPEVIVRLLNPLAGERNNGSLSLAWWYDVTAAHAPRLWEWFYQATNNAGTIRLGTALLVRLWGRRLRTAIQTHRPGIVVAVHPLCARLTATVLSTIPDAPPLHCVVTDLVTIHRCWACPEVDVYYVATHDARDALVALGVCPERIRVSGLPLRASFARVAHQPAREARARVLLLGGGHPSRRVARVARVLAASCTSLDLAVVCGRNTRMQRRLARSLDARARVLGWRDDIDDLMRWSTVVVTKAGPTTVAEALSQARPLIFFHALRDQETGNVDLAERAGCGKYLSDDGAIAQAVMEPQPSTTGAVEHGVWWGGAAQRVAENVLQSVKIESAARASINPAGHPMDTLETPERVICNPISGERIVIRQSGEQTGGRLLSFDLYLPPGAHVPARHVHPMQEERFMVVEGRMRFRIGWRRRVVAGPGETIVVPPGTGHWFGNAGKGVSHARVEVRPALRLQEVFERSAAMDVVEHIPGMRMPRLADLAPFLIEFHRELAVPGLPPFLVRGVLTWLGRLGLAATRGAGRGSAG